MVAADPAVERRALEAFYDATGGPDWDESAGWKTSSPLADWHGVTVRNGTVVGLQLGWNGLSGPIPSSLRDLRNLVWFYASGNDLSGQIPGFLGEMPNLGGLGLRSNDLTGPLPQSFARRSFYWFDVGWNHLTVGPFPSWICGDSGLRALGLSGSGVTGSVPPCIRDLHELENLWLGENWGLTGGVPAELLDTLQSVWLQSSRLCVSSAGEGRVRDEGESWFAPVCGSDARTVDVAVFYTPAARRGAGGEAAIGNLIDLMVVEANGAYRSSGVRHRIELVHVSEVDYAEEGGEDSPDLDRFTGSDDGFMDGIHGLRDRSGADLAHLIFEFDDHDYSGRALYHSPFGVTCRGCGGLTFAHELGHNMGLKHDRYASLNAENDGGRAPVRDGPEHGFVDVSGGFRTVMAYELECTDSGGDCPGLGVFSNPGLTYSGRVLGVPYPRGRGLDGPAHAAAVLDYAMPAVSMWRDRPGSPRVNRSPAVQGVGIPDVEFETRLGEWRSVTVRAGAFSDPDGDRLRISGMESSRLDITPEYRSASDFDPRFAWSFDLLLEAYGTASLTAVIADPGGLEVRDGFSVTVRAHRTVRQPFTDEPLVVGVTPIRAVHFTEIMDRIDELRRGAGYPSYRWTAGGLPRPAPLTVRVDARHLWRLWDALSPWCGPSLDLERLRGAPVTANSVESVRRAVLSVEAGRPCQG